MVRTACACDTDDIAAMASALWDGHDSEEMRQEMGSAIADPQSLVALYLCEGGSGGFAHCTLRHDYVEGTHTSPVGYLEGIYVQSALRSRGAARELLSFCEKWAAEMGCTEFASDCEADNTQSLRFHMSVGFEKANSIICFRKTL